jgi:hypothetical protein
VNITVVEPVEIYIDRARDFVRTVEIERLRAHAALVFYRERPDSLPIKYLINMPQEELPTFVDSHTALLQVKMPAFFVTSQAYFEELPPDVAAKFHVIAKNTLGHVKVVVFTQR